MDRFWNKVDKTPTCWLWTASKLRKGYGRFVYDRGTKAHRYSYELHKGAIPAGTLVRHTCHNPACVNPAHLVLGSHQENMDDMRLARRSTQGERNPRAKLTQAKVTEIRQALAAGISGSSVARRFGVTRQLVSLIKQGKLWGVDSSDDI